MQRTSGTHETKNALYLFYHIKRGETMSDSFYFPTYSGLLTPQHKEHIGPALWEFLWLISKTTKEIEEDGETLGIVLGGIPIKIADIANEIGSSERTVKRNLARLKEYGYLETLRTPHGEVYKVRKSKKFIKKRSAKNGTSEKREVPNMPREVPHLSKRSAKNGTCNKDIKDIKKDIKDDDMKTPEHEFELAFYFPPATLQDDFKYWIESEKSQFVEPEEIIIEVIHRAQKQMPRNPATYVSKILNNLHSMELYTLDAVKAYNKKFDEKFTNGGETNGQKVSKHRGGYGRSSSKSAEQLEQEAAAARKSWGG
jgi:DNA-binding MarR family transcriptional regulator